MRVVPTAAGPEAELARLSRPTGPWLHLLDAAPADARQLGWLLGQDGVVVRQLRGHCGRSTYGLLDEMGAALQLPGDPVEDWESLAALLTDMAWLPGAGHVLVVTRASLLLAAAPAPELRGLVEAVRAVARGRAEEGDPVPFHLVLQDDPVGLAALRPRLDAVGARYVDLVGWEASEPVADAAVPVRSVLTAGDAMDPVDSVAAAAASTVDGVTAVRRAWEEFRGGSSGPVRVYVPVLTPAADPAAVAAAVSAAVAAAGAACVVVPVPADPALVDSRQAAVAAAATELWPHPQPASAEPAPAEPARPAAAEPAPAEPGRPASAEPAPAASSEPASSEPAPSEPAPSEPALSEPALSEPAPSEPAPSEPASGTGPAAAAAPPGHGAGGRPAATAAEVTEPHAAGTSRPDAAPVGPVAAPPAAPRDEPGASFELIAANLQWPFDTGSDGDDAVDTALRAHAAGNGRTAALFRTWVQDPAGGWVRVILGYVNRGSIAEVEAERSALVETLQRSGAGRCCVEVLAASDASDAHRWLERRCRPLWSGRTPAPGTEPPHAETPQARAPAGLGADTTFRPGPAAGDAEHGATLTTVLDWAATTAGVVGVVTAWTGDHRLVVGVALDGDADPDRIRAAAPVPVEPFAPARGLSPVHLRLSRSATRIWTRRTQRAAPARATAGALDRPAAPTVTYQGPPPTRDTEEARGDVVLGEFTLVGIDRGTAVGKGEPTPDEQDAALVEWARARAGAVALLRGVTEERLKVYCLAVEETADPEATRRDLAGAAARAGLRRAAVEAFAPAGAISAFHPDLAVASTRLWPVRS